MTYVITQPCCNDATCVSVCPVNCIHPTPDEENFASAEMLYIDPETCIDCAACTDVCPVDAIFADDELDGRQERYLQINADYYTDHAVDGGMAAPRKRVPLAADTELHVAIVGAGPAAFYAAGELIKHPVIKVDMFDRLPTPYGLVRAGVAPDHPSTKGVEKTFAATAGKKSFTYHLGVEVGHHVHHEELAARYGAVIYAHGASADRSLGIEGEDLPGSVSATEFVAWYNGHPDHADRTFDLSAERVVVVGNGNVALDVARILLSDHSTLATTDIADHALEALAASNVKEVVLLARRGVAQAAYTAGEFLAMGDIPGVDVIIDPAELELDSGSAQSRSAGTLDSTITTKIAIAEEFAQRTPTAGNKRVVFRYLVSPVAIHGTSESGVQTVDCIHNTFADATSGKAAAIAPTGETFELQAGVVMRAVGYMGTALKGLPFDDGLGVVPNLSGRVLDAQGGSILAGVYVTGWIKRGATGGIGMNRKCGEETAGAVVADFREGKLRAPSISRDDVADLATERGAIVIDKAGWSKIDKAEQAAARGTGRRRIKMVSVDVLWSAATS